MSKKVTEEVRDIPKLGLETTIGFAGKVVILKETAFSSSWIVFSWTKINKAAVSGYSGKISFE